MYGFLIVIFVIVCILMVVSILLQSSKGGGLASSFGGLGSSNVLGPRGAASFLQKATTVLAVVYMLLSIFIGLMSGVGQGQRESVIQRELNQMQQTQPLPELPVAPIQPNGGQQQQPDGQNQQ